MIFLLIIVFSLLCYYFAKQRIIYIASHYAIRPSSLPKYYGINIAVWNMSASILAIISMWVGTYFDYSMNYTYIYLAVCSIFMASIFYILAALKTTVRARDRSEQLFRWLLNIAAIISILITIAILFTILFEAIKFFHIIPIEEFILGTNWSPQSPDYMTEPVFGVLPVLSGTLLITLIAMLVAIPLGLLAAIYLNEYSTSATRAKLKPILEILAGIPTVVYGYFAVLIIGPCIRLLGEKLGLDVSTESALAAGLVMGIMIIPFILSISDDAIASVPQSLRDAALALGSTQAETMLNVVLPAASAGVISGILLAISRAIGETMIVTMAAGIHAKLTFNPLDSASTFTTQIVALLVGDQEFDSPKTLSAFALALTLFVLTLIFNLWAMMIIKRRRAKYE